MELDTARDDDTTSRPHPKGPPVTYNELLLDSLSGGCTALCLAPVTARGPVPHGPNFTAPPGCPRPGDADPEGCGCRREGCGLHGALLDRPVAPRSGKPK